MEKGEFAAATPVEPTQVVKRVTNKGVVFGMIIFMLTTIGLGVWVAILLLNPPKSNNTGGSSSDNGDSNVAKECDSDKDKDEKKDEEPTGGEKMDGYGYTVSSILGCSRATITPTGEVYIESSYCQESNTTYGTRRLENGDAGKLGDYTVKVRDQDVTLKSSIKVDAKDAISVSPAAIGQNWTGDAFVIVERDGTVDIVYLMADTNTKLTAYLDKLDRKYTGAINAITTSEDGYSVLLVFKDTNYKDITEDILKIYEKHQK